MARPLTFSRAIQEATDLCMAADPRVYVIGLGVPDPKGIFGTTAGLQAKYGPLRVMDMPCSEGAVMGIVTGSALVGMRPIMTHQRIDFALLAVEQIVNQAAKWHYMFGGKMNVPVVIRLLIGRGWGQGPQHSQSLQAWFAHVPGLKVVMPATPHDAKGLLIASVEDDNPVIFLEHRWLHNVAEDVPEGLYRVPLGEARVARVGQDVTLVCTSYMVLEGLRAAETLAEVGIEAEVVDLRTLRPLDTATILNSVRKTGRVVVVDTGHRSFGISAEIAALAAEQAFDALKAAPVRIALPDCPTPTSPALAEHFYPRAADLARAAARLVGKQIREEDLPASPVHLDVPDASFKGPF